MLGVMALWSLKSWLNFWKMILLWSKSKSNWSRNKTSLKKIQTLIYVDLKFKFVFFSLTFFLCNHNSNFVFFRCICNIKIEDWRLVLCCSISNPYLTFSTKYPMMKWAKHCGVLCFGAMCLAEIWNLLSILSFICCTLFFCKCFWGMCIVLGSQFCFVLQIICFNLWLDFSLDYKANCCLCSVVVGFVLGF
jgi:hypothetical protein